MIILKKAVYTLIVLMISVGVNAQNERENNIRFGLSVTPNLGWIKPSTIGYTSNGSQLGFAYGIMGEFQLMNNYMIATGFYIKSTGGKLTYPDNMKIDTTNTAGILDRNYSIQYVEIPFTIKMKTRKIGYFTYFGLFGLGTSFNIKALADDVFTPQQNLSKITTKDNDIQADINFLRESLIIGLGTEYSMGGSTSIVFSLNYNNGFTDIFSGKNAIDNSLNENATSSYIDFNIGVLF